MIEGKIGTEELSAVPTLAGDTTACQGETYTSVGSVPDRSGEANTDSNGADGMSPEQMELLRKNLGVSLPRPQRRRRGKDKGVDYDLNANNFNDEVMETPTGWLVRFIEGDGKDKSDENNKEWLRAARGTKSLISYGTINMVEEKELANLYGVSDPGTVLYFKPAVERRKGKETHMGVYEGKLKGEALRDFANQLVNEAPDLTQIITSEGFDMWFQNWPFQPRILFATGKEPPAPALVRALAIEHNEYLQIGFAHDTSGTLLQKLNLPEGTELPVVVYLQARMEGAADTPGAPPGTSRMGIASQPLPKPYTFNALSKILDTADKSFNPDLMMKMQEESGKETDGMQGDENAELHDEL